MSLAWISKPFISRIEEEAMSLSVFYYCICTCLCRCHSFNPSLCHLSPFHLSYVAVSRPCCLSEFTLTGPHEPDLGSASDWLCCKGIFFQPVRSTINHTYIHTYIFMIAFCSKKKYESSWIHNYVWGCAEILPNPAILRMFSIQVLSHWTALSCFNIM